MEMSIDDAIETLKDTNTYGTADLAKRVAIDTMCKYKKIERILGEQDMPEWSYSKFKAIASIVREGHDGNDNIASETRNP